MWRQGRELLLGVTSGDLPRQCDVEFLLVGHQEARDVGGPALTAGRRRRSRGGLALLEQTYADESDPSKEDHSAAHAWQHRSSPDKRASPYDHAHFRNLA